MGQNCLSHDQAAIETWLTSLNKNALYKSLLEAHAAVHLYNYYLRLVLSKGIGKKISFLQLLLFHLPTTPISCRLQKCDTGVFRENPQGGGVFFHLFC